MIEVPAGEIVSVDKTSGVGPATIKLTAGPNPVAEERTANLVVTSRGNSKSVRITQEAGEQVVTIPSSTSLFFVMDGKRKTVLTLIQRLGSLTPVFQM